MTNLQSAITIRLAHAGDERALHRLAALDSASVPAGPLLLAEVEGVLRAALSLADGSAIADPFAPTADVVALLREWARTGGARRARRIRRLPSVAVAAARLASGA